MKRKLYFFLEKLEIRRSERIAIVTLLVCMVITSGIHALHEPVANYDPVAYAELEKIFNERSQVQKQAHESILARYQPEVPGKVLSAAATDTVPADTLQKNMEEGSGIININEADADELRRLPGIGPAYANRIIEWRETNGPFTTKRQLLEIRGIGEKRLANILSRIEL